MKLIVGLGNPGREYDRTRHNAGFMALDVLAQRHASGAIAKGRFHGMTIDAAMPGSGKAVLLKPTTYMNLSGRSVNEALRFYKLEPETDLLVITDDVALPTGSIRLRPGGGAGGHNGLKDITKMLGSEQYPRLRMGVGPKPDFINQADFVLGRFIETETALIESACEKAADACEMFCAEGLDAAMNKFNAKSGGWGTASRDKDDSKTDKPPQGGAA
ncbi:MAG: aminoacyl-tRNA hydrolase [Planctomycetota bacterium]